VTIVVEPNPAVEGQPVTVRVDGSGPYFWRVSGEEWTEVAIDPETGQGRIDVPPGSGGDTLVVSDRERPNPDNAEVPVNASD
jgi:hypothetical protein